MQFPAVNWHEGLFLQPHHFQAWDRHWSERVSVGERWQNPHSYGLLEISINRDALATGFLQVDLLRCKTPGGSIVEWDTGITMDRRDLRPALEEVASRGPGVNGDSKGGFLDVFVGIPRLKLGDSNLASASPSASSRYRSRSLDLPDEIDAACVKPIELKELNAQILLSTDDLAGFDALRIARVRRSNEGNVEIKFDSSFIPPLIDCRASPVLRSQILSPLMDAMQQLSHTHARQIHDSGGQLTGLTTVDLQRILVLQAANPAAAVLRVLSNSPGLHPLQVYIELVKIAASFDLLNSTRNVKQPLPYDHEDLGSLFGDIKKRILSSIEGLQKNPYWQYLLSGYQHGLRTSIDKSTLDQAKRWYLGIQCGSSDPISIHRAWTHSLWDWKAASSDLVEKVYVLRAPGIEFKRCENPPNVLPKAEEWLFYEIVDLESQSWLDVQRSGWLSIRFGDSSLVHNETLQGESRIFLPIQKSLCSLQFSLFGVP